MKKTALLISIFIILPLLISFFIFMKRHRQPFCEQASSGKITMQSGKNYPYLLFEPADKGNNHPLLIILHGKSERGRDNKKPALKIGCSTLQNLSEKYNSYVFLPQCPDDYYWVPNPQRNFKNYDLSEFKTTDILESLKKFIKDFSMNHPVDTNRIYISGHSMGALAVWKLLYDQPDFFAAALPVSTSFDPSAAERFKNIPLWLVMGADDPFFKNEQLLQMYDELVKHSEKEVKYSLLKDKGHDVYVDVLKDSRFTDWLFRQARRD